LKRALYLIAVVACVVVVQVIGLRLRVKLVDSADYRESGTELRVSRKWRYGFLRGQHGAFLVRVPLASEPPRAGQLPDSEVYDYMKSDLANLPRTTFLESGFYLALGSYLVALAPWVLRRLAPGGTRKWVFGGGLGVGFGALFLAPQFFLGYGASAFSTYVGPGALSSSGPYARLTFICAETVSYRPLLELVLLGPTWLFALFAHPFSGVSVPFWLQVVLEFLRLRSLPLPLAYWLLVVGFFFMLGAVLIAVSSAVRRSAAA
jgi:hypothetical protein